MATQTKDPIYDKSKTVEWYTPPEIIDLVEKVFNPWGISLDPASCKLANDLIVKADKIYTQKEDGLSQSWLARTVFLNPPYGLIVGKFVDKLIQELNEYKVTEAILLINSNTSTKYWQKAFENCSAYCFPSKRIAFVDEFGTPQKSPRYSNTIFYFGGESYTFANNFRTLGIAEVKN